MSERAFKRWILQPNDWYLYHTFGIFQSNDGYLYRNYGSTITSQVLTSKLSGLDLNEGRARGGDSGVVSATIHWPVAEKMKKKKCRYIDLLTLNWSLHVARWVPVKTALRVKGSGWSPSPTPKADLTVEKMLALVQNKVSNWALSVCWWLALTERIVVNI